MGIVSRPETRTRLSRRTFLKGSTAAAGAAALAGCGILPDGTVQGFVPDTSGSTRIRLAVWGDVSDAAIYDKILKVWHSKQDRYRAVAEQYTGDYYSKVLANFAGGVPADVIYMQGWMWQSYAESGVLHPLDEFIERDGMRSRWPDVQNFHWNTQWRGRTYMSPADGGPLVMYYNKDIFDRRNVPYPKPDWTWDDFRELVPRLTFKDKGKQIYGWAQGGGFLGAYGRVVPFIRRNGYIEWDRVIEPREVRWKHPDVISALQFTLVDAIKNGWSPGPSIISGGGVSFATNTIGLTLEGPWYLPNLHGPLATTPQGINYDVVPPPLGTDRKNHSYAHIHGHVIASQSPHKEGAWELIKFITSDEGQRIIAEGARMCATPGNVAKIWGPVATKDFHFQNADVFSTSQREGTTPIIMGQGSTINAYGGDPLDSMWTALESATRSASRIVDEYQPKLQNTLDQYWKARQG